MSERTRGRPRSFDRDYALLEAARLFWRQGYSGTSTRALSSALGLSTSSLYAAFGDKAALFEEAVRTYAERYRQIYEQAVLAPDVRVTVARILSESVEEFTRTGPDHPGCLIGSAVMADSPETLDVRSYIAALHRSNERTLLRRLEQAVRAGELPADTDATALTGLIQSVWHGLSAQSNLGRTRRDLLAAADVVLDLPAFGGTPSRAPARSAQDVPRRGGRRRRDAAGTVPEPDGEGCAHLHDASRDQDQ